jgi:hypothetical protein
VVCSDDEGQQGIRMGLATDEIGEDDGSAAADVNMAAAGTDNVALTAGDMLF